MEPPRKRSAAQANLAFASRSPKRRQTPHRHQGTPVPGLLFNFPQFSSFASSAYATLSKAMASSAPSGQSSGEYEDSPDTDVPGSFPETVDPSSSQNFGDRGRWKHAENTVKPGDKYEEETIDSDLPTRTANSRDASPIPTQASDSRASSPAPQTPPRSTISPSRGTPASFYEVTSHRSTPFSSSSRKGGSRNPLKPDYRRRAHPLAKQRKLEQKLKDTQELYLFKRAHGYSQDLNTFRGYLTYREHLETFFVAADKKLPPPTVSGPEAMPPLPSSRYLHRAFLLARKTLDSPRPTIPRFSTSELIAKQNKERDEEIERRLRPKLPDTLPPQDEAIVRNSLGNRSFMAKVAREQVASHDLTRLRPGQWLNDEIINFYGAMISERAAKFELDEAARLKLQAGKGSDHSTKAANGKGKGKPTFPGMEGIGNPLKVHVFSTYFLSKLQDSGYEKGKLNKWTKKVDIFSKDLVVIPCNLGNSHWTTAAINFREKRIEYYDSMGMDRPTIRAALREYLDKEHRDKKQTGFDSTGWTDFFGENGPQQENGYDCGVFLCQTMENLSRGVPVPFDFTQENMPYLRRRMILEITAQQLPIERL